MKKTCVLLGCLTMIASCDDGSPAGPTAELVEGSPQLLVPGGADDFYDAGDTVTIVAHFASGAAAPPHVINAAETAVSRWNSQVLGLPGHENDLPHFKPDVIGGTTSSGTIARIVYADNCSGGSCGYCGSFNGAVGGVREILLQRRNLGDACGGLGRVVDDLAGVIMHEISHVLGFGHQSEIETRWCVTNVPGEGNLNPYPCRWEQQSVYRAYLIRNSDPLPGVPIASKIVILPNPDTVLTGASDTIRARGLVGPEPSENVDAGGGPGPLEWVLSPDTISVNVTWDDLGSPFFAATKITTGPLGRARIDGIQIGQGPVAGQAADQADSTVATAYPWAVDTATIVVESASGLNPCFDADALVTWRMTDQYLTTTCGSTGPNIRYRWRFQAGGPWTSFSPETTHEFLGHSTANTYEVTVEVKDTSTGATEQFSREFDVHSQIMSASGPTYVTTKQLQTYQASHVAAWYERYETSLQWFPAGWTTPTTYDRIWPAGDYTRRLRAEGGSGGALGRDWLDVVVCHESFPDCGPEVLVSGGEGRDRGFPLFGGGPWILAGNEMVRFYDLAGGHETGSPFSQATWLDASGEQRASSADGGVSLTWKVSEPTVDTRRVEFVVDGVAGAYTFGLALDPDVGRSPADDRSVYDPIPGVLVVHDGEEAIAIALQKQGIDDIRGIRQYGALIFAPRATEELRRAVQDIGVRLVSGPDDVQLLVSGSEVSGVARWTLLMARGADAEEAFVLLARMRRQ